MISSVELRQLSSMLQAGAAVDLVRLAMALEQAAQRIEQQEQRLLRSYGTSAEEQAWQAIL